MRRLLPMVLAAALLGSVAAAPADDPEVPEKYITVDEVKANLDEKKPVILIDVRPKEQYDSVHIRGAASIPLMALSKRLAEVPRQNLVVLY